MSADAQEVRTGRRLDLGDPLVAGIDLGGTKTDVALVGPGGQILGSTRIATNSAQGAVQAMERALAALGDLLPAGRFLGAVGVGVPGVVHGDRVSMAPNLPGLESVNFADAVSARFREAKVIVVNDLNAAASAELHGGALDGVDTALVVGLGTGIASGVIVGGQLRKGALGAAGEIGLAPLMLLPQALRASSPGRFPTLEEVVGGAALNRLALSLNMRNTAELLDRATSEERVRVLIVPRLEALVSVLAICVHLLSPERLFFFGGLASHPYLQSFVTAELSAQLVLPLDIIWAKAHDNAALRGAVRQASVLLGYDHSAASTAPA